MFLRVVITYWIARIAVAVEILRRDSIEPINPEEEALNRLAAQLIKW